MYNNGNNINVKFVVNGNNNNNVNETAAAHTCTLARGTHCMMSTIDIDEDINARVDRDVWQIKIRLRMRMHTRVHVRASYRRFTRTRTIGTCTDMKLNECRRVCLHLDTSIVRRL